MGVFNRIRGFLSPGYGNVNVTYFVDDNTSSMLEGMNNDTLYRTQPHLRTVISYLSSSVAQTSLKCYIRESDNDRKRDADGVLPTLLKHPNVDTTGYELLYGTVSDLLLNDMAMWVVTPNNETDSGWEIRQIPYDWISAMKDGTIFAPASYVVTNPKNGVQTTFKASDVIVWHGWSPTDPQKGVSPVRALKQVLGEQVSAWKYREQLWRRAARVPAYISRPKDVVGWTDEQAERFKKSWKNAWSGNGSEAGGTPVLEDGMEIKQSSSFNFNDAQWAESCTLSLETVCAVYHLNPALVGSSSGQTYASVKENARQLYTETLGPILRQLQDRMNQFLLPRLECPENEYVEFDLSSKLSGSFEEQASVIQSSVGAPWMTRNEARAMFNMPHIADGDDLIVPMNVIVGGLSSPNDTTSDSYAAAYNASSTFGVKSASKTARIDFNQEDANKVTAVFKKFFERQRVSVLASIGAEKGCEKSDTPSWWNADRWNKELADDLYPVVIELVAKYGRDALKQLALDEDLWNTDKTAAYVKKVCQGKAVGVNDTTLRQLIAALAGEVPDTDIRSTPEGVFDNSIHQRAAVVGAMMTTIASGWAPIEAVRQSGKHDVMKTWIVTSGNPRDSHARMNGETVPYDEPFSNGAYFPGDSQHLGVDDVAGCTCVVELTIND